MLSDLEIKAAISRVSKRDVAMMELKDDGQRGGGRLALIVRGNASGATPEWYAVWYRDKKRISTKIGNYPAITLAEARLIFRESYQPDILAGKNPQGPRSAASRERPTIAGLCEGYVQHLRDKGTVSAERVHGILLGPKGLVNSIGPSRAAADVQAEDIIPHLKAIRDRGSIVLAANVRAFARAAFQFGLSSKNSYHEACSGTDWGYNINPVVLIPSDPAATRARDRFLTADEIRLFWRWLESKEWNKRYRDVSIALRLMLITGQRPGEILTLGPANFDPDEGTLAWKKTKNGRPHLIPLPDQALQILDHIQANKHGLYFPRPENPEEPRDSNHCRAVLEKYLEETGADHFTTRDLRRTWKTWAGAAGLSKEIRDRLQNHSIGDVSEKHYDRYTYLKEKLAAMEQWDKFLGDMINNVPVPSRRRIERATPVLMLAGPAEVSS